MTKSIRLGMIVPSSNTVLEPTTAAMVASLDGVSAHFARLRVRRIADDGESASQFDRAPFLTAADLLADAKVDVIAWNGTSGAWLGHERDRALCDAITTKTGVPATTSALGLIDAFEAAGVRRYGLVTPYIETIQSHIIEAFDRRGLTCVAERHDDRTDNYSFATISASRVADMVRDCAQARPDAIAIVCTNMVGATLAESLERETGIPTFDSVSLTVWASLRAARASTAQVRGWGRLFQFG